MDIREVTHQDLLKILFLNNLETKWVGNADVDFFEKFLVLPHFYVEVFVRGFLLAMDETVDYNSKNYLWFKERFVEFLYIDRVVVDPIFRKQRVSKELYWYLLQNQDRSLVCEASVDPPNIGSILDLDDSIGISLYSIKEMLLSENSYCCDGKCQLDFYFACGFRILAANILIAMVQALHEKNDGMSIFAYMNKKY